MTLPEIVDHTTWYAASKHLLEREKAIMRQLDELSAERRRLPMVHIDTEYRFTGPEGEVGLRSLFGEHRQLIVQHFMFDPAWDQGCPSCSAMAESTATEGVRDQLAGRGTAYAAVSWAPLEKISAYREEKGWTFPWYSSYGSDFNVDFHVTVDPDVAPGQYNFRDADENAAAGQEWLRTYRGEQPGITCFLRDGDEVYRTYSTYGRGVEAMMPAYRLLDLTGLGRQEGWEQPIGRAEVVYRTDTAVLSRETVAGSCCR